MDGDIPRSLSAMQRLPTLGMQTCARSPCRISVVQTQAITAVVALESILRTFGHWAEDMTAPDRFLLYIDILGFSEMIRKEPRKVARLYSILDSLNVHKHGSFKTIVFSDTILTYNHIEPKNDDDRSYLVWYLTEFAEDLHRRLTGQEVYFRAVLTSGDFSHYQLKNIECFYGAALVKAYLAEKNIPSLGLFMDESCIPFNRYFRLTPFDAALSFVYLNRSIEYFSHALGGDPVLPIQANGIDMWSFAPDLPWDVRFMKDVYRNMRSHSSPAVRTKFLTVWDFYEQRYPRLMAKLVASNFKVDSVSTVPGHWDEATKQMERQIRYYKRIGSGTTLSKQISAGSISKSLSRSSP